MKTLLKTLAAVLAVLAIAVLVAACKQQSAAGGGGSDRGGYTPPAPSSVSIMPGGNQVTKLQGAETIPDEKPAPPPPPPAKVTPGPVKVTKHVTIQTVKGDMEVELYGKDAPKTVANFVKLAGEHFYKGLTFHRVESDPKFRLIQGGDPKGDGSGSSSPTVPLEISPKLRHVKGAIAMARTQDPNSASCQFYICINDIPQLDDQYAVFGKVTKGLEAADKIVKGDKIKDIIVH